MAAFLTKKRIRIMLGGLCVLVLAVVCLSATVDSTGVLNWLIRRVIGDGRLQVTVGQASLGWLTPLRLTELVAEDPQRTLNLRVQEVTAGPWPRLWWNFPDLGDIDFERPRLEIVAKPEAPLSELLPTPRRRHPLLTGTVHQADVQIRTAAEAAPVIHVEGLDLRFRIADTTGGRWLQLEPTQLLRQEPLTADMFARGLQLVAPILAHTAFFTGSASLRLEECRIPLDDVSSSAAKSSARMTGVLTFHSVSAGLKNPLLLQVAAVVSHVLRRELPTHVKIVENSEVQFSMADGRVHHDGLTFVLPELSEDLVIVSAGSVGLDETLDLQLEVPLPLTIIRDGPVARRLSERPLRFHVGGTLKRPSLKFRGNNGWLDELVKVIDPDSTEPVDLKSGLLGIVDEVLEPDPETGNSPLEEVLQRIRQRRQERRSRSVSP